MVEDIKELRKSNSVKVIFQRKKRILAAIHKLNPKNKRVYFHATSEGRIKPILEKGLQNNGNLPYDMRKYSTLSKSDSIYVTNNPLDALMFGIWRRDSKQDGNGKCVKEGVYLLIIPEDAQCEISHENEYLGKTTLNQHAIHQDENISGRTCFRLENLVIKTFLTLDCTPFLKSDPIQRTLADCDFNFAYSLREARIAVQNRNGGEIER